MNTITFSRRCLLAIASALLVVSLSACGGGSDPVELPLRRLDNLGYRAWPTKNYVIRSDAEWQAAWNEHIEPIGDASVERPSVDFTKDAVVGVSAGWGGCDSFGIERIIQYGEDLVVEWHQLPPPQGAGCAGVLSPFYDFVLIPASINGRVDFVKTN